MKESMKYKLYQVDVFTKNRYEGNPAGVVPNADGLTDCQMQQIARELNNSETAFIFPPEGPDHDVRVRFFTPTVEVPSCGHATVAAHYVRAHELALCNSTVVQKIGAGILPVEIQRQGNDYQIFMQQAKPEFLDVLSVSQVDVLFEALNLTPADLIEKVPIQIVSTGHSKVMIGLKESELLYSLKPNFSTLAALSDEIGCKGYYIFALQNTEPLTATARMFAPAIGINEDPVNGNGSGPLGAYLVNYDLVAHGGKKLHLKVEMGKSVNRPGTVKVSTEIENGKPVRPKIGGSAVIAFETEVVV